MLEPGAQAVAGLVGGVILALLLWTSWTSLKEGEPTAARRLGFLGALLSLPFFGVVALPGEMGQTLAWILLALAGLPLLIALLPLPGRDLLELGQPLPGQDERDIMFSRATLVPGTDRFEEYYRSRPQYRKPDDQFRREPGLLAPGSAHYHREGFAAADAAFWTIERLRPFVEGDVGDVADGLGDEGMGPVFKLGGERSQVPAGESAPIGPDATAKFLKAWALKMGAHSAGITELRDYHLYSHVGRGPDHGEKVELDHTHALALTVEMDKEMVDRAPRSPTAMESALQYVNCGVMAVQLADLIRRLGHRARAHVDGCYRVICPLVARDAGLGEIGRMGLLMTPRLGPRVRIAVVTTDLPLAIDPPAPDLTTIDFCVQCRKCADSCPSRALPFGPPEEDENGVFRWKIDPEACFTLWGRLGTDCARCMAVCPYSHPDNAMHSLVRWGIQNNGLFRRGAVWMDDLVYGRRPPPKEELEWMKIPDAD
jgi:ferredoxin